MGLIATIKQVLRQQRTVPVDDIEADIGGGDLVTSENFAPIGEDAVPLPGDQVFTVPRSGQGRDVAVGFIDPKAEQLAQGGERRLYSRDGAGAKVAQIWLKQDGSITLSNDNGSFTLNANGSMRGESGGAFFELENGGDFIANDARMTSDGDVVTSDGISLRQHVHTQGNDSAGDTQVPTNPPTPS